MKVSVRERQLHVPEWNSIVEALRHELGISPGTETEIDSILKHKGPDNVASMIHKAFRMVQGRGVHGRYLEYFAACVVSHFTESTADHRLPAWLSQRLSLFRQRENPLPPSTLRIEFGYRERGDSGLALATFSPEHPVIDVFKEAFVDIGGELLSSRWKLAWLPYAMEVLWPYDVPRLTDQEDFETMKSDLRSRGVNMAWIHMHRFVMLGEDNLLMLPLLGAKVSEPTSIQHLFGLPESTPIGIITIHVPVIGGDCTDPPPIHSIQLSDRISLRDRPASPVLGEVRPFQPTAIVDSSPPNEERPFIGKWRELIDYVTVHPSIRGGRGRPKEKMLAPVLLPYSELVEEIYRRKLKEWGEDRRHEGRPHPKPTQKELRSLWNGSKREAQNHVKAEARDMIGKDLLVIKRKVEDEVPWNHQEG